MMDWTDRHCRFFHRLLAPHARLYTEMVTTGALIHGDQARHLDFDAAEHPVALQLGGSEPADLAVAARLGERWGYDEINLNCGCPSERVQRGAFGACLMAEPHLVADCVRAMCDVVSVPVTVKHRIGIDQRDDYGFVRDFVGIVSEAGCQVFVVHARKAILKGLSPKQNREIPPLRPEVLPQLRADFPHLIFVFNGGVADVDAARTHLQHAHGVMLGRAAYQDPGILARLDAALFGLGAPQGQAGEMQVVSSMQVYADRMLSQGVPVRSVVRHMLGLFQGLPGARAWRRILSDATRLRDARGDLLSEALACVATPAQALGQPADTHADSWSEPVS